MVAGPFILGLMPESSSDELRFIDDLALAIIAFITGGELFLKDLKDRLRVILTMNFSIVFFALLIIGVAFFVMAPIMPFGDLTFSERFAVAFLGGTVLLALSPASTIAVIQEVRARGNFTRTVLSIAVVMDVIIIILFAISTTFAGVLIQGGGLDLSFVAFLLIDIALAIGIGVVIANLVSLLLSQSLHLNIKIIGVVLLGGAIYTVGYVIDSFDLGLHIEPLLAAMSAGFYMTNFTPHRDQFEEILHRISPTAYVAFFTLTGVSIKLDILVAAGLVAFLLFLARIVAIAAGTVSGTYITGEKGTLRKWAWAGLITQAGIALGLARETANAFPSALGDAFATIIIAVVVLNEIFGPLFLKFALRKAGETHEPQASEPDEVRDAVIFGIENQAIVLSQELANNGWFVTLADCDADRVAQVVTNDRIRAVQISSDTKDGFREALSPSTDAVVTMLEDDQSSRAACEVAYEEYGVKRLVARLNDPTKREMFNGMGVQMVDATSAIVSIIDQSVRAPASAQLLLHEDPNYDIRQITLMDRSYDGRLVRDLRLPEKVLILEITRNGQSIVPAGYTRIFVKDELTLIGEPAHLDEVTVKLGY